MQVVAEKVTTRKQELELHVTYENGQRRIVMLPPHYTLKTAVAMAEQGVQQGSNLYAGVFVNGKMYCEYEA